MASKANGPLPPLTDLKCAKLSPEQKRQKAAAAADGAGAASSAEWKVTQAEAKAWFVAAGEANTIGQGAYGETRKYLLPSGRWVVVKEFIAIGGFGREGAQREAKAHLAVWRRSDELCRQCMAEPAAMSFETNPNEGSYTVQSLIRADGMTLQTFEELRDTDLESASRLLMHQMSTEKKIDICKAYGAMRACIAKAHTTHDDLHSGNVLCLTNYPMDDAQLPLYAENKDAIVIEWRVVDWGKAVVYDEPGLDPDAQELCWHSADCTKTHDATYNAGYGYVDGDEDCIVEAQDQIPTQLYPLLFEEDSDCSQAKTAKDCVTVADVFRWVREGFANALNKRIPADLAAATERKAREDRAERKFPDGGGGGASSVT